MHIFILPISIHHVIVLRRSQIKFNIHYACKSMIEIDQIDFLSFLYEYRNGLHYYRAQEVMIPMTDILWKRSPEDYCQGL